MLYRLGETELDAARFELRREGRTIPVERQVLELLIYLVAHRDRAVTRAELFDNLWRGRVVTESALTSRIKAVRATIGDDGSSQAQIRTLHRTGYRFVGPVEEFAGARPSALRSDLTEAAQGGAAPLADLASSSRGGARARRVALGALAVIAVLAVGLVVLNTSGDDASLTVKPGVHSLAVLPFIDLSPSSEHEYFAAGLSTELLTRLAQVDDLLVTAERSSFAFKSRDGTSIAEIGDRLGVEYILDGTVRKDAARARITVQLVEARTEFQAWSEFYDRELGDTLTVQREIASAVVKALSTRLGISATHAITSGTSNFEAYDLYLSALSRAALQDSAGRVERLDRALALDPTFTLAWLDKVQAHRSLAVSDPLRAQEHIAAAVQAAGRAVELEPRLPAAHVALVCALTIASEWRGAQAAYRRARELGANPDEADHDCFVVAHGYVNRFRNIKRHDVLADPLSAQQAVALMNAEDLNGDWRAAVAHYQRSKELGAGAGADISLWITLLGAGQREAARAPMERLLASAPDETMRALYRTALEFLDSPDAALAELHALPLDRDSVSVQMTLAPLAAYFGDPDLALSLWRRSAETSGVHAQLIWRPLLRGVRELPEFKELMREGGFVDFWHENGWPDLCSPVGADDFDCSGPRA